MDVQVAPSGCGSLEITLRQGLYHDVAAGLCREFGQPQLVFCSNAGELYLPLRATLRHLW